MLVISSIVIAYIGSAYLANTVPELHACGLMGLMLTAAHRLHVNLILRVRLGELEVVSKTMSSA